MMKENRKKRAAPKRAGPGRPQGQSDKREHILDAAELLFSETGYNGTSLREIADKASVTQALLNYYFGSKEGLFAATYLRRGEELAQQRMEGLERLKASGTAYGIREIIREFIRPAIQMRHSDSGRTFIRLQACIHIDASDFATGLRRRVYDASTNAYLDAIRQLQLPMNEETIYWRMIQFIGVYLYLISDAHRLHELSGGVSDPNNDDEFFDQVIAFCAGGFLSPDPAAKQKTLSE